MPGPIRTPMPSAFHDDAEPPWLAGLNAEQREAVEALEGPLLVLAGAGTGKTRVLTCRIAHTLAGGRAGPHQILAVTFTNRAAAEMGERVERLIRRPVAGMALGTFHAISSRWLRRHAELVGLSSGFTILDTDDQLRLIKQILEAENVDAKRWTPRHLAHLIDRWKNRALSPDEVPAEESEGFAQGRGAALYRLYEERLRTLDASDFGSLIVHMIRIWQEHDEVRAQYQERYRYLLVDEYQDTNVAQYLWLRLLAAGHRNICCVGDDDQSIYGWRGAEVGNILRFEEDYPGARVIRLERNYRSTGHILGAASSLIAANEGRLGKTLWTDVGEGEKVRIVAAWDGEEEARVVCDLVEEYRRAGLPLDDIAILVRAGFQTRQFEERLIQIGLPYRVVGGPRFYERQEVRDALAYLRLIHNPADDLAFERIVNVPKRGIGSASVQKLQRHARASGVPLFKAATELSTSDELRPQTRRALSRLVEDFLRWREEAQQLDHTALAQVVLEESGYVAMWQQAKGPDAPGRLENLSELVRAMEEFENLAGFLEHISLVMENETSREEDKLSLMTLHAAKGLEFDTVFLPGWEEGVFPNQRSLDEGGLKALEEERRLAHVGLTRARRRAIILHAANRLIHGQWQNLIPSRFLDEIDPRHVTVEGLPGMGGGDNAQTSRRRIGTDESSSAGFAYQGYDVELTRGPGWARAERQRRLARQAAAYRQRRSGNRDEEASARQFSPGMRVFHQKFGYGEVRAAEGAKLVVDFETSGDKHVMASFVEPAEG